MLDIVLVAHTSLPQTILSDETTIVYVKDNKQLRMIQPDGCGNCYTSCSSHCNPQVQCNRYTQACYDCDAIVGNK